MTHIWQWNGNGKAPEGLIEGIADYVRLKANYSLSHWVKRGQGDGWDEGYDVTAGFLDYCNSLRNGFLEELNKMMRSGYSNSYFVDLLGKNVDQLRCGRTKRPNLDKLVMKINLRWLNKIRCKCLYLFSWLLFTKANEENCVAVKNTFEDYERASDQMINFSKSAICVSPSMSAAEGEMIASLVGVKLVECHENYLGLSYFSGRSKQKLFANIIDHVWGKIKGWGEKLLSIGGNEVLIKAMVQAVPSYAMSLFRIPKSLILEIQRLCAHFWWGGNVNKKKIHWCT
ncbi:hypothetical protein Dsin_024224 [Dipteronia sinensis]|uniref:Reverse transcriptase n=1 Tax=Dipteronia sinensis TaxID=43782 RepID=A0AAD9ZUQ6_9ROSI|nr:hypothetical protein Dsin_024224 [Dipteronia sinensis]